jgi:hypothetical protein
MSVQSDNNRLPQLQGDSGATRDPKVVVGMKVLPVGVSVLSQEERAKVIMIT